VNAVLSDQAHWELVKAEQLAEEACHERRDRATRLKREREAADRRLGDEAAAALKFYADRVRVSRADLVAARERHLEMQLALAVELAQCHDRLAAAGQWARVLNTIGVKETTASKLLKAATLLNHTGQLDRAKVVRKLREGWPLVAGTRWGKHMRRLIKAASPEEYAVLEGGDGRQFSEIQWIKYIDDAALGRMGISSLYDIGGADDPDCGTRGTPRKPRVRRGVVAEVLPAEAPAAPVAPAPVAVVAPMPAQTPRPTAVTPEPSPRPPAVAVAPGAARPTTGMTGEQLSLSFDERRVSCVRKLDKVAQGVVLGSIPAAECAHLCELVVAVESEASRVLGSARAQREGPVVNHPGRCGSVPSGGSGQA
jgi:hypothetical protein